MLKDKSYRVVVGDTVVYSSLSFTSAVDECNKHERAALYDYEGALVMRSKKHKYKIS